MGDVLDAVSARIKAPYFGYAVLAFIALNWRAIFMLAMTDGSPDVRLAAFDDNTNFMRMIVWPLVSGAIAAAVAPWIRFAFDWISYKPISWGELLQLKAEDQKTKEKTKLERSRAELFSQQEEELIARAKRDQQVSGLDDELAQRKVQEELKKIRDARNITPPSTTAKEKEEPLSKAAITLLKAAAEDGGGKMNPGRKPDGTNFVVSGKVYFGLENARELSRYQTALSELEEKKYISRNFVGESYLITEKGWRAFEKINTHESFESN